MAARNAELLERIRALKADHPFWGYRRIWAHLRFVDQLSVGRNRVHRLMKEHGLAVRGSQLLKAKRKPTGHKPRTSRPNQWWGIDMTKVMIKGFGWVYVVIVLDWCTKKVVGHYAGLQARAWHWLAALNKAVKRQFPEGARGAALNLMSDNGCQPTSVSFMKACRIMGVNQAFTSYSNPKGSADTERYMGTLKQELVRINEFTSPSTFLEALDRWIDGHNTNNLRSTLGYRSPEALEAEHLSRETLLADAC